MTRCTGARAASSRPWNGCIARRISWRARAPSPRAAIRSGRDDSEFSYENSHVRFFVRKIEGKGDDMPLQMSREVFITCAVTGSGGTQDRSPHVPRSPQQIADSAIDAAKAGAAIVHCHVRDPETGAPSRRLDFYREVTDRIRDAEVDVVLNLTAGMGGDITFGPTERPLPLNEAGTDMIGAAERVEHIARCLPEICTLDCGTMNFAEADYVMTNTPGMLRAMGRMMTHLGVKPEIEAFDTGHLWFAKELVKEGVLEAPARGAGGQPVAREGRAGDQCAAGGARRGRGRGHGRAGDGAAGGARKARPDQTRARRMTKRVLVTAGASGIGRAIAERFLIEGAEVAICDVDVDAVADFASAHPAAIARVADVTREADVDAFLSLVEASWDRVDVVCANAGTGGPAGLIETLDYGAWQDCVAVNLNGAFLTCRWAARLMRAQGHG